MNSLTASALGRAVPPGMLALLARTRRGTDSLLSQPAIRRALPSILILGLALAGVLGWFALRAAPASVLYPGLPEAERAQMLTVLQAAAIPATLSPDTGDIRVATADYHRARMALAAEGLPAGLPDGNALLSDLPMGASHAVEGARLRQALELDLARTIGDIGAVSAARVHLALPERSAFLRDSHPPAASVLLTLAPGRVLDSGQIAAIVHLVASSVPGMAGEAVTVVDQRGRMLSDGGDAASAINDRQLAHRVAVEDLLRQRIEAVLAPVVGVDNLSVQVTAALDFSQHEVTEERMDPSGTALRSETLSESRNADPPAGGIPGAVSNNPPPAATLTEQSPAAAGDTPGVAADGSGAGTVQSASTRNFEVSRTVASTRAEVGRLTRISAAIVLRAAEGDPAAQEARLSDLRRLAEQAVGLDPARGDSLTIVSQPFAPPPATVDAPRTPGWLPGLLRQLAVIAAIVVTAIAVLRPLAQRLAPAANQAATTAPALGLDAGGADGAGDLGGSLGGGSARQRLLAASVLGSLADRDAKREALRRLAAEDPQRIAIVLHRMIHAEIDQVQ